MFLCVKNTRWKSLKKVTVSLSPCLHASFNRLDSFFLLLVHLFLGDRSLVQFCEYPETCIMLSNHRTQTRVRGQKLAILVLQILQTLLDGNASIGRECFHQAIYQININHYVSLFFYLCPLFLTLGKWVPKR